MKKIMVLAMSLLLVASACTQQNVELSQIDMEEQAGNFTSAKQLIDLYIAQNELTEQEIYDLNFRKDVMNRIAVDFNRDEAYIIDYFKKYYPDVDSRFLESAREGNRLESMIIDGERKYFSRSAPNFFRLDEDAKKKKEEVDGVQQDNVDKVLETHLPEVVSELKNNGKTQAQPKRMKVKYTVTLNPNVVPDGEIVSCWLPYPREDNRRQTEVKLISVNDEEYVIAPDTYAHRTLYMQKEAKKDEPLEFSLEFSYSSAAEWFNLSADKVKEYDTTSELYKEYTIERETHVIFTDEIKNLSKEIVGSETNPYQKLIKIFDYINDKYPWAGAREYSTLANIPSYVIANNHGDCGQVSLLLITLARYNGIPAKWQSGFMVHPQGLNLHDWAEVYFEGVGWIPVDQSFGRKDYFTDSDAKYLFSNGIDAYRWIVNDDYSQPLFPLKVYPRSETVDFQRGELEWRGGNIYFNQWKWDIEVDYLN